MPSSTVASRTAGVSVATRARMQRQRRRDTAPELAVRHLLHARGLRYRVDVSVLPSSRRRHDIVFTRAKVVVEVRGCFWHGCAVHGTQPKSNSAWWTAKIGTNVARDRDTEARLAEAGWRVVVVWEHDDPVDAADHVERLVRGAP